MAFEFSGLTEQALETALYTAGLGMGGGMAAAVLLSVLGYGIFKAMSLININ